LRGKRAGSAERSVGISYRCIVVLAFLAGASALAAGQASAARLSSSGEALSCSPAPCALPPTQVSPGPNDVNSAPIAANPSNPGNIMVGGNDANCGFGGVYSLGFFISLDDGSAWNQYCMTGRTVNGQVYLPDEGPILGYDLAGNAYIGGIYYDENESSSTLEAFQKSSDGLHWSLPASAVYRKGAGPAYCWMAVDTNVTSPYANSVYVSCFIGGLSENHIYTQMVVSHSNDGGKTWHLADVTPPRFGPLGNVFNSITVGGDGTVYLVWQFCGQDCGSGPAYMAFSRSNDGGNTWSSPRQVAKVGLTQAPPNWPPFSSVANTPAIGVDNSTGPNAGNLYVAMYNWTGTFMQVVVVRSTDGGNTWSKPTPVAPGITHDQFLPWLSVSPNGLVGVMWLDRRNDPANVSYQAFAAISTDGGLTFQPNVQLTENFSNPNVGGMGNASYNGAAWNGPNYFLAAWMDTSNGVNTQDVVGGIRLK